MTRTPVSNAWNSPPALERVLGMPKMKTKKIELASASALHKENPDTFEVPDPEKLEDLVPGDYAKVIATQEGTPGAERFWIRITGRDGDRFSGLVSNTTVVVKLELGDPIEFTIDNIIDVQLVARSRSLTR